MPSIQPGAKVLVTGVNGFLAMWCARRLLERGYAVRGTVRSGGKGAYVEKYFERYGDRFEAVVVDEVTKEGAFDESLAGVHGVFHVATPRIVYTSTVSTIKTEISEPTLFSEKDWNDKALEEVKEQGINASNYLKYTASKVLAEKSAWHFYEKNKEHLPYDFLTILPAWIFGPPIHELSKSPTTLGQSSYGAWYSTVIDNPTSPRSDEVLSDVTSWVDVRDLADVHVSALEKEEVGGERIVVPAGRVSWQQWIDTANQVNDAKRTLPLGKPGIQPKVMYMYDSSKEARIIGTKFREIGETTKDSLIVFLEKGW
ncbi:D-lactaldehyde dehydrogenase [Cyathus striatus]|nr:D-lactaldehyde dehydrogenase [Cyathus striatus]